MSRKQRTNLWRKNYRAWKQEHKQQSTAPSVEKSAAPNAPAANREPIDHAALIQQLRNPNLSSGERDGLALDIEQYALSLTLNRDDPDPDATELISDQLRRDVLKVMREFGSELYDEQPEPMPEPATISPGHSTGPCTAAGLARSSQNARKHGLSSLTSIFVMMPGEDPTNGLNWSTTSTRNFNPRRAPSASLSTTWPKATGSRNEPSTSKPATSKIPNPSPSTSATKPRIIAPTIEP